MSYTNLGFAERVRDELDRGGYAADVEATVGGLTPDFVVHLSNGQSVILEAKGWEPSAVNLERAVAEVQFFREQLGALEAFVVLPGAPPEAATAGIVGLEGLLDHLAELERWRHKGAVDPTTPIEQPKPIMFCAMPFDGAYDDVYFVAMAKAADEAGLAARRVDQDEFVDDIVDRIVDLLNQAVVVVADLSEARPNVLYEVGYAHALGKPVVAICSTPLDELPFDVSHNNTLEYNKGQTHQLGENLAARVAAVKP